ncbi:MAG: TonB-dependent receptor [Acidobacteria bacterium]|nr:TonB-dependent receptor [Acidobacteriota bacterium]
MKKALSFSGLLVVALICGVWASRANAQAVYGSILGTVTDPQGAAVVGAKVTVTDQNKGTVQATTTNGSGNYSVTHLIPDPYSIKIEAQGFKAAEQSNITVTADNGSLVDLKLQVGSTSEAVEVTSEAPQLKTDRADVSTTFNARYVGDLPILNRNFTTLQLLAPGSQKMVGWSHAATENPQGSQQIFTQGQHFSGTAFELDGTDNQDPILGIIVVNPNLDAVTEAKVSLQNYDAEFGKAVSSVVTAQTKSGTNDFHGSAFWFRRTDATQAKDPFTQWDAGPTWPARPIPSSRWQQFGGTVGGPIIKNKLFFFGDYQATRQLNGVSGTFTLPTARVRSTCNPATNATSASPGFCDLSEYADPANGVPGKGQVFDPATGSQTNGSGRSQFCGPLGCAAQPNWIPIARISPAAAAILEALPAPQTGQVLSNYIGSGSGPYDQNSFDTRIDYSASSTVNVFGRFSLDYFKLSGKGLLGALQGPGNGLLGLAGSSITHNYSLASGLTKTFSSSLLADFRFGYFKYNPQTQKPDGGTPMTAFGIPGANTNDAKTAGLGAFLLGGDPISGQGCTDNNGSQGCVISSFGDGLGIARCNCPLTESEQQFQVVNNWTKIIGNHQIKFGADLRYAMNLRVPSDNNRTGEYSFSPEVTSNGGSGGLDLATFLLGDVSRFARYINNPVAGTPAERQKRAFFYGQDTFRATPKLTINYGLRWEIYFPETVNVKDGGGFANISDFNGQGAIRVAGEGGIGSNGNVNNTWHGFAPRLGIAYQLTTKTVLRMGYGRSYDIGVFGSNFGHTVTQNLPVLLKQNIDASAVNPADSANLVPIPGFTLDAGPTGPTPISPNFFQDAIDSSGRIPFTTLGGEVSGIHIRPTRQVLPTVDAWNATIQRQLTNTMSAEVAYVGSKGTHGFAGDGPNYDINPPAVGPGTNPTQAFLTSNPNVLCPPGSTPNTKVCGPASYAGFTPTTPQNNRRPLYPLIPFDLGNYYGNDASSNYNAFEVKVEKRFSQGLQFLSHYTYARANGYDSNYYAISHPIAYGPVDFNRNHVFVINTVYDLPLGKGKAFLGNSGKGLDYVVGGWQLSNTTNWSSGLPWTPSTGECGATEDVGICRPSVRGSGGAFNTGAGSFNSTTHTVTFFTPISPLAYPDPNTLPVGTDACSLARPVSGPFVLPLCGQIGNLGRNSFRGPRGFYSDLSLAKRLPITERVAAQFRMDAFNVFNHPVYAFSANNGANACIDCQGGNNGKITGIENGTNMRELQFSLRLDF